KNQKPETKNQKPETRNQKLETRNYNISFCGAKNPLIIYRAEAGELEYIKGSRKSIGGLRAKRSKQAYERVDITAQTGDVIYLLTDGIIDQHSKERDRFSQARLLKLIEEVGAESLSAQESRIEQELKEHKGDEKQTDDISLIGIKL
ncbi:MAG: serine/threonine-protein phosphatase, partial [Bacteroidales bacterium]|nr:serine/threonine-protein phosphatase [Bacteroidales bacterium]